MKSSDAMLEYGESDYIRMSSVKLIKTTSISTLEREMKKNEAHSAA